MVAPSPFRSRLAVAVLLSNLLVFALAALSLSQSRHQYQERAEITTRNLAQVLENHIAGIFDKIDIVLLAAVDESEKQLTGDTDDKTLNGFLARQQARLPELDSLRVADARGLVSFGTGIPQGQKVDISDRQHFIRLRDNARAGLVIAEPVFARINQKWVLPLARRINHPDGSFAGIAYAFVPLEYFYHSFSALNVGPRGIVTLRETELGIVVRHPEPKGTGSVIGQKAAPPPLREMVSAGRKAGTYLSFSTVDGIERTFSYRRVGNYPFLIIVGLASDDYFSEWRNDASKLLALAALFSLATLLGAWLIYRAWKHRTLATEALHEEEKRFRAYFERSMVGMATTSPVKGWLDVNDALCETLGYSREELLHMTWAELTYPEDLAPDVAQFNRLLSGEIDSYAMDKRFIHKDGHLVYTRLAVRGVRKGAAVDYLVALVEDISERKRAETQLRELNETLEQRVTEAVRKNMEQERLLIQQSRLAAMGEMVHNIAHQWRQPLNALALLQANIKDAYDFAELSPEIMQRFTETGQRLIQKMSTTIDDFRDFFKPRQEKSVFQLSQAIEHTLLIVGTSLQNHDIAIACETDATIHISGYANEFSQVLLNVLNNAKEAILGKQVQQGKIDISLGQDEKNAWVVVKDNGGGIPPASLPKIFDPYYTTKDKGTGIGLYMSRMIMEHMDGAIEARNSGDGAELRMTLPKAAPPRPA